VQAGVDLRLNVRGEISDLEFTCKGYVTARGYVGVIIDGRQRPSRLLRGGREAAEETGDPETHTAFIGERIFRDRDNRRKRDYAPDQTRFDGAGESSRLIET
jgi:hypothetical protein